jgi:hypothetical protein
MLNFARIPAEPDGETINLLSNLCFAANAGLTIFLLALTTASSCYVDLDFACSPGGAGQL